MAKSVIAFCLLPFLIAAPATWCVPPPLDDNELIQYFNSGNFKALEDIKARALQTKERNTEGDWQLDQFYRVLFSAADKVAATSEAQLRTQIDAWSQAYPNSVTWRIVLGDTLINIGWRIRGVKLASAVTPEQWVGFDIYLIEAWNLLQEARKLSRDDPQLYATFTRIVIGAGRDPTDGEHDPFGVLIQGFVSKDGPRSKAPVYERIFEEAIQYERYYEPLYRAQAIGYLPRWHGGPGEAEHFAERAAELTADQLGDRMYATVASKVLNYDFEASFLLECSFDRERWTRGFDQTLEAFPDAVRIKNEYCRMACIYQDRDTALKMLQSMARPMPLIAWGGPKYFDHWNGWITGIAPYPTFNRMAASVTGTSLEAIEALAKEGESVNIYLLGGHTPLMLAVGKNDLPLTELLLRYGAEIEVDSIKGNTPLTEAARFQDTAILETLLKHGADPNRPNPEGWCAIHRSAKTGNVAGAKLLLAAKADVNVVVDDGWTPLHMAAESNHPEMITILLANGANKSLTLKDGRTALDIAKQHGFNDIVKLLE